jgi:hypothetical protein
MLMQVKRPQGRFSAASLAGCCRRRVIMMSRPHSATSPGSKDGRGCEVALCRSRRKKFRSPKSSLTKRRSRRSSGTFMALGRLRRPPIPCAGARSNCRKVELVCAPHGCGDRTACTVLCAITTREQDGSMRQLVTLQGADRKAPVQSATV